MRLRISAELRLRLDALNLEIQAYQPVSRFLKGYRKLPNVPNEDDPWTVSLFRKGEATWGPGASVGRGHGATLEDAIRLALPPGDLLGAISRLAGSLGALAETYDARA